jgi:hypothetical protein
MNCFLLLLLSLAPTVNKKNLNRKRIWRKKERKKEGKSKRGRFVASFWVEDEIAKVFFATYRPHKRTRTYFFAVKLLSYY